MRLRLDAECAWIAVQMLQEHPFTGGKVADDRHFEAVWVTLAERAHDGSVAASI